MNGKLGRLRKDTLYDIAKEKYKRNEKKKSPATFEVHGDKRLIISNFDTTCAVCHEGIRLGQFIWFDPTKEAGKKVAHRDCWVPDNPEGA